MSAVAIPSDVLRETAQAIVNFRDYWFLEIPVKIHTGSLDRGGVPAWHPDFARWLGTDYYGRRSDERWRDNPEPRVRTKRAFRKLRRMAVREFEVCYRIVVLGSSVTETTGWLNERAARNGITDRYTERETILLLVSGVGKMISWW